MRHILGGLALAIFLGSCQVLPPPNHVVEKTVALAPAQAIPDAMGRLIPQANTDQLEFRIHWPQQFRNQTLDTSKIHYLRLYVRGTGIPGQIWNGEGFVPVTAQSTSTLMVQGIPRGKNRLVLAQAYDADQQAIPGGTLTAVYSSPPQQRTITVYLKWRYLALGKIMEKLLDNQSLLAATLDTEALQQLLDKLLYQGANPATNPLSIHPTRLDVAQIVSLLETEQGKIPENVPTSWLPLDKTTNWVVRNSRNLPFGNSTISLSLNDPVSAASQLTPGQDTAPLTKLPPGQWTATAKIPGLNGGVQGQSVVEVSAQGDIQLLTSPLLLPPVLTSINGQSPQVPAGLSAWWQAETNANETLNNYPGTLNNGAALTNGDLFGSSYSFDGVDDYIDYGAPASLKVREAFTASVWVKPASAPGVNRLIYNKEGEYEMWHFNGGAIRWSVSNTAPGWNTVDTGYTPPLNQWTHLTLVYNTAAGTGKFYANGNLIHTQAVTGIIGDTIPAANNFMLGRGQTQPNYFHGLIDEMRLYHYPLSDTQVLNLYQQNVLQLAGDGFEPTAANNSNQIAGISSPSLTATATNQTLLRPQQVFGPVSLTTQNNGKTSNSGTLSLPPIIAKANAGLLMPGDTVTLSGKGFDSAQSLQLSGVTQSVATVNTVQVTATVPANVSSGNLVLNHPSGQATGPFFFNPLHATSGLVGWWKAENNAQDITASYIGALSGNATYTAGRNTQAFLLDGSGDYITVPANPALQPAQLTMSAWANMASFRAGSWDTFIAQGNTGGDPLLGCCADTYYLGLYQGRPYMVTSHNVIAARENTANFQIPLNTWIHFSGTYDGSVSRLYVNGYQVASQTINQPLRYENVPLRFGEDTNNNAPAALGLNGKLDDIQLYNRALNADEIMALYLDGH